MTEQIPEPNPAWWPLDYMDEIMPGGRVSPDAWIVEVDGVAMLAPIEEPGEAPEWVLADGDIVKFISCVVHAHIGMTLTADGYKFDEEPPAPFGQCCILNGLQSETLADDVPTMIESLREVAGLDETDFLASFYTYDDGAPYRFIAAERRFEKVTAQ